MAIIEACCEGQPISAGLPGAKQNLGEAIFPILMHHRDSAGNINGIPAGTVVDEAFIEGKLNNNDDTLRWTMFPKMTTLVANPASPDTEDQDGVVKMMGFETKQPLTWDHTAGASFSFLIAAYKAQACDEVGVIFVTRGFHVTGKGDGSGNLLNEKIEDSTISAVYQREQNKLSAKVQVSITPDTLEDDSCHDWVNACNIDFSAKNWFAKSPIQVHAIEVSASGLDTFVIDLGSLASGFGKKYPTKGILSADFSFDDGTTPATVFNVTTSTSVVVVSVPDAVVDGRYELTLAAPAVAAEIIKIDLSVVGFSMISLEVVVTA